MARCCGHWPVANAQQLRAVCESRYKSRASPLLLSVHSRRSFHRRLPGVWSIEPGSIWIQEQSNPGSGHPLKPPNPPNPKLLINPPPISSPPPPENRYAFPLDLIRMARNSQRSPYRSKTFRLIDIRRDGTDFILITWVVAIHPVPGQVSEGGKRGGERGRTVYETRYAHLGFELWRHCNQYTPENSERHSATAESQNPKHRKLR